MNAKQMSEKTYSTVDKVAEHAVTRLVSKVSWVIIAMFIAWLATETSNLGKAQATTAETMVGLRELISSTIAFQERRDSRQDNEQERIERRLAEIESDLRTH